jgi:hypothetical protein
MFLDNILFLGAAPSLQNFCVSVVDMGCSVGGVHEREKYDKSSLGKYSIRKERSMTRVH